MTTNQLLSALSFIALSTSSGFAAANSFNDSLFSLDIEDLLKVKVSVASVETESVTDTPAIVSRYERTDLEAMGVNNLRDIFNFVPGVIVQNSLVGIGSVQIRGIDETFNQKVLFLLDGIPYHQPSHSFIPLDGIAWESISHIEVIRGPGTVFHGTQASGGVINVVTKQQQESTVYAKIGSDSLKEASAYLHFDVNEEYNVYLGGEARRENGETVTMQQYFPDVGVITDDIFRELEKESVLFKITSDNINFLTHVFSDKTMGLNDAYADESTLQTFTLESDAYLVHLDTKWQSGQMFGKFYVDYNFYTFDLILGNVFAPEVDGVAKKEGNGEKDYRFRVGTEFNYQLSKNVLWTLGLEQETRSFDTYGLYLAEDISTPLATLIERDKAKENTLYSQIDYTKGKFRYVFGGRYTDNEFSGSKLSPRVGVVYGYDEHQSIKMLYSTGFNSPNPVQTSIYLPGNVIGNKSLSAETVKSFDLAYSYSKSNVLFVANIYQMKADDFIVRRFSESLNSVSFFNEASYTRRGAEFDLQLVGEKHKAFINMAYSKEGNNRIEEDPDAYRVPSLTLSAGYTYHLDDIHSIGTNASFIGERAGLGSFSVFGFNYTGQFDAFEVVANVNNAFGKEIKNPNNSAQNSTLVAYGEVKANYELGIRFKF